MIKTEILIFMLISHYPSFDGWPIMSPPICGPTSQACLVFVTTISLLMGEETDLAQGLMDPNDISHHYNDESISGLNIEHDNIYIYIYVLILHVIFMLK